MTPNVRTIESIVLSLLSTVFLGTSCIGLSGCSELTPEERITLMKETVNTLADAGVAGQVVVTIDGTPSVGAKQDFYLNTGVGVTITGQFNPGLANREDEENTGLNKLSKSKSPS